MSIRNLVILMLCAWLACYGWSFIGFRLTPPEGSGFTRGMNRVALFFGWQALASVLALVVWLLGRRLPPGTMTRRLSRVPGLIALGLLIGLIAVFAYLYFGGTDIPQAAPGDRLI